MNSSNIEANSEDSCNEDQDHEEDQLELRDYVAENMSEGLSPYKTLEINVNHIKQRRMTKKLDSNLDILSYKKQKTIDIGKQ